MAALAFDLEPPPAHEGAPVPIGGAQRLEHRSQAFIGEIGAVVRRNSFATASAVVVGGGNGGQEHRSDRGGGSGLGGVSRAVALGGGALAAVGHGGRGSCVAHSRRCL